MTSYFLTTRPRLVSSNPDCTATAGRASLTSRLARTQDAALMDSLLSLDGILCVPPDLCLLIFRPCLTLGCIDHRSVIHVQWEHFPSNGEFFQGADTIARINQIWIRVMCRVAAFITPAGYAVENLVLYYPVALLPKLLVVPGKLA